VIPLTRGGGDREAGAFARSYQFSVTERSGEVRSTQTVLSSVPKPAQVELLWSRLMTLSTRTWDAVSIAFTVNYPN
jgi:hypothetical protein